METALALFGDGAKRKLTAPAEKRHHRAFSLQGRAGPVIMHSVEHRSRLLVVAPNLSGNNTLTGGRNALIQ